MSYFSPDYFTARSRWREAAAKLNCRLEAHQIDAAAPIGDSPEARLHQRLTIDVAILGNPWARKALVISSGLHGVEGFLGSAVQLALFDRCSIDNRLPSDLAIVSIHILNPFGCAWYRRTNEDNIDLNRNFLINDETYQGCPPDYPDLDSFINPSSPPTKFEPFIAKSLGTIASYGMSALKNTLPVGQYEYPQGLFFGGRERSQTYRILTAHLRRWLGLAQHVIHIDLHSGLGKWGNYQLFAETTSDSRRYDWLADRFDRLLALDDDDRAYQPRGTFGRWCQSACPDLTYDFLLAEFGTYPMLRVLKALRAENRAHWWSEATDRTSQWAKQELIEAFAPQSMRWRKLVVDRGLNLCLQAIDALEMS
jgi:hypothetical protein